MCALLPLLLPLPLAVHELAPLGEPPALVLAITVDQLRGDMLPRFCERFGEGGFARLLDEGVHFRDAHYAHSTTYTAVGHATLFSGAHPAGHGIVGNDWADAASGERVYCVEDPRHTLVGAPAGSPHAGTSPRNLVASTIGDELVLASGGRSRVFAVSIKDRGAILPAGHHGRAYWYAKTTGGFQTSTYYHEELPAWAARWNAERGADALAGAAWTLLGPREEYVYGAADDRPCERPPFGFDRTFPHALGEGGEGEPLRGLVRYSPFGDELTLSFVEALFEAEEPGGRGVTDLVAVSFSCTDYIGHAFGPNSLEAEDNLLRLDRTLARLLAFVDARVGLERTVIVLSSDHGVDAVPEYRHALTCATKEAGPAWVERAAGEALLARADTGSPAAAPGATCPRP